MLQFVLGVFFSNLISMFLNAVYFHTMLNIHHISCMSALFRICKFICTRIGKVDDFVVCNFALSECYYVLLLTFAFEMNCYFRDSFVDRSCNATYCSFLFVCLIHSDLFFIIVLILS